MNALRALKKTIAQWLPVDREFMYKTLGEMWCKQPRPLTQGVNIW